MRRFRTSWLGNWHSVWLGCFLLLLAPRVNAQGEAFAPFNFAVLGDPQLGYGPGAEWADTRRFSQVVEHVAQNNVPVTVVVGDLVEHRTIWQHWAFDWVWSGRAGQGLLLPGNHDVLDEASLAKFRERHGRDYYDFVHNNCAFIALNSETARSPALSATEFAAQWAFLEQSLKAHVAARRTHIFLAMHRPPFVEHEFEPDSDANWPRETREKLLTLARTSGVRWLFAGHLHRTHQGKTEDGLQIVVLPGSSRVFDDSPVGYQLLRVEANTVQSAWVTVAERAAPPWHVPGFREWTPRLFDFSVRHWLLTLFYAATGAVAFQTSKRTARTEPRRAARAPRSATAWLGIAVVLWAFAANLQLDLDELIREVGRGVAKLTGIAPLRHVVTGSAAALTLLTTCVWLLSRARRDVWYDTLALACLLVPLGWFGLSAISHHDLRMLFSQDTWDGSSVVALGTVLFCARQRNRALLAR